MQYSVAEECNPFALYSDDAIQFCPFLFASRMGVYDCHLDVWIFDYLLDVAAALPMQSVFTDGVEVCLKLSKHCYEQLIPCIIIVRGLAIFCYIRGSVIFAVYVG